MKTELVRMPEGLLATLTEIVTRCEPVYRLVHGSAETFLETVEHELGVPVGLTSSGPTFQDKALSKPWLAATST